MVKDINNSRNINKSARSIICLLATELFIKFKYQNITISDIINNYKKLIITSEE